jgi:hypothetical protein
MDINDEAEIKDAVCEAEYELNQVRCEFDRLEQIYSDAKSRLDEWLSKYG